MPREKREKRRFPRFLFNQNLKCNQLSFYRSLGERKKAVLGQINNISLDGLCLDIDDLNSLDSVVVCKISLSEVPIEIPTLMSVRWIRKNPMSHKSRVGLQFLL